MNIIAIVGFSIIVFAVVAIALIASDREEKLNKAIDSASNAAKSGIDKAKDYLNKSE